MSTKYCPRCETAKPVDEFHWRNKSKGVRASACKPCKQAYESAHYRKSDKRKNQIAEQNRKGEERNRAIILEAKSQGCVDCDEMEPLFIDMDHLPQYEKLFNISDMPRHGTPALLRELAKCEPVCVRCHRVRTRDRLIM